MRFHFIISARLMEILCWFLGAIGMSRVGGWVVFHILILSPYLHRIISFGGGK